MGYFFPQFGKAAIFTVLLFISVYVLTGSFSAALIGSLVPLVLGSLNILPGIVYGGTGLCFIAAVLWLMAPQTLRDRITSQYLDQVMGPAAVTDGQMHGDASPPAPEAAP